MSRDPTDPDLAKVRALVDRLTRPVRPESLNGVPRDRILDAVVDLDENPLPPHRVMWIRARLPFDARTRLHAVDALRLFGPAPLGEG